MVSDQYLKYLKNIQLPSSDSHKGQNGKLMIVGGSDLFHAASKWSLDIASKFVDMVFYASVPSNNELVQQAKGEFWNGIVVRREDLENYIEEADCILIGPGMTRSEAQTVIPSEIEESKIDLSTTVEMTNSVLSEEDWNSDTEKIVNYLLSKYPQKKWVIDAGALQMVDPSLLNQNCILTPHYRELFMLFEKVEEKNYNFGDFEPNYGNQNTIEVNKYTGRAMSEELDDSTLLIKGKIDGIFTPDEAVLIEGGNAGMTKGGTGDVLAGLVAALYCTHDALTSAVVGSYINKKAGDSLYQKVGPYFNASDLVDEIPIVFWDELSRF